MLFCCWAHLFSELRLKQRTKLSALSPLQRSLHLMEEHVFGSSWTWCWWSSYWVLVKWLWNCNWVPERHCPLRVHLLIICRSCCQTGSGCCVQLASRCSLPLAACVAEQSAGWSSGPSPHTWHQMSSLWPAGASLHSVCICSMWDVCTWHTNTLNSSGIKIRLIFISLH